MAMTLANVEWGLEFMRADSLKNKQLFWTTTITLCSPVSRLYVGDGKSSEGSRDCFSDLTSFPSLSGEASLSVTITCVVELLKYSTMARFELQKLSKKISEARN